MHLEKERGTLQLFFHSKKVHRVFVIYGCVPGLSTKKKIFVHKEFLGILKNLCSEEQIFSIIYKEIQNKYKNTKNLKKSPKISEIPRNYHYKSRAK